MNWSNQFPDSDPLKLLENPFTNQANRVIHGPKYIVIDVYPNGYLKCVVKYYNSVPTLQSTDPKITQRLRLLCLKRIQRSEQIWRLKQCGSTTGMTLGSAKAVLHYSREKPVGQQRASRGLLAYDLPSYDVQLSHSVHSKS